MKRILVFLCLLSLGHALPTHADIAAVLASPDRFEGDRDADANRKPDQFLEFVGIEPGMAVIDIFAGGGYYTEIVSRLVGEDGFVTMYNNRSWDEFVAETAAKRLAGKRLPNVDRLIMPPEDIGDLPDKFDAAIFVLGMHDVYYADEANNWPLIDRQRFLQGIYNILDDGAVLGVIDHKAAAGTDPAVVGKSLHRVDPAVLIRDFESVGFTLEAQSDMLANPQDDHTVSVFDPSIRNKTDRSVMRFRK